MFRFVMDVQLFRTISLVYVSTQFSIKIYPERFEVQLILSGATLGVPQFGSENLSGELGFRGGDRGWSVRKTGKIKAREKVRRRGRR